MKRKLFLEEMNAVLTEGSDKDNTEAKGVKC